MNRIRRFVVLFTSEKTEGFVRVSFASGRRRQLTALQLSVAARSTGELVSLGAAAAAGLVSDINSIG
jgi:hypothetical protein